MRHWHQDFDTAGLGFLDSPEQIAFCQIRPLALLKAVSVTFTLVARRASAPLIALWVEDNGPSAPSGVTRAVLTQGRC